jgi:hypothetical protein
MVKPISPALGAKHPLGAKPGLTAVRTFALGASGLASGQLGPQKCGIFRYCSALSH